MTCSSRFCCLAVLIAGMPGCSCNRDPARFVPSEQAALKALGTALAAWQQGRLQDTLSEDSQTIRISDSLRKPGQTLKSYEILGPVPGDSPRCFAVQLKLENPTEELKVRYVVFGPNPYWVVRHEDLIMLSHWDHPPEQKSSGKKDVEKK